MLAYRKKTPLNGTGMLIAILTTVLLSSCKIFDGSEEVIDEKLLTGYHTISHPSQNVSASEQLDCYLDYSDGMKNKTSSSADYYLALYNEIKNNASVKFYRVGASDEPEEIPAEEANFRTGKQYTDNLSKLESAVKRIVGNKQKIAVFITDFEKIVGGVQNQTADPLSKLVSDDSWGSLYFKEWLNGGNRIDIFATPCTAQGQPNWVYTLVFTPHAIAADPNRYDKSFTKFLADKITPGIKHFTYCVDNYRIEQEGKTPEIGNANDNSVVLENITGTKNKGFEYYRFASGDLITFNTDDNNKGDKRIINKLRIVSENAGFDNVDYDIKVYDITSSIGDYSSSLSQAAPEVKEDQETGDKDTVANKPVKYSYKGGEQVNDAFDFVYNKEKKQAGLKLKPDFSGVPQNTVYQVDIVPKTLTLKSFSEEDNVLVLRYKNAITLRPLRESVYNAIRDAAKAAEGKPIYTIYIRIDK